MTLPTTECDRCGVVFDGVPVLELSTAKADDGSGAAHTMCEVCSDGDPLGVKRLSPERKGMLRTDGGHRDCARQKVIESLHAARLEKAGELLDEGVETDAPIWDRLTAMKEGGSLLRTEEMIIEELRDHAENTIDDLSGMDEEYARERRTGWQRVIQAIDDATCDQ